PAAALARDGVPLNAAQAYIFEILEPILVNTPEASAVFAPAGRVLREGEPFRDPELAVTIERFGAEGAAPFYDGDIGAAIVDYLEARGGQLTRADLAAYAAIPREPVRATYRGREVLTNPPPSAGGTLLALAMARLDSTSAGPPSIRDIVDVMEQVQGQRTPEFLEGLPDPGFAPLPGVAPGVDDARLGDRRRRAGMQRDVHERRGRGNHRARHRRAREQHHGRAGPQPARILPLRARA